MTERHRKWTALEYPLAYDLGKSKWALDIIKRYYLKGVMPDFEELRNVKFRNGHLDLLCFIWFHPSRDELLLQQLRDQYVHSPLITEQDVGPCIEAFINSGILLSSNCFEEGGDSSYSDSVRKRMITGENELLFDVLLGDINYPKIPEQQSSSWSINKFDLIYSPLMWAAWFLRADKLYPANDDVLSQYDEYLDYWYHSIRREDIIEEQRSELKELKEYYEQYLYAIYYFDVEREGDTSRSRMVRKFRKLFDDRDFLPEFEQIWADVKAGKIEKKDLWDEE